MADPLSAPPTDYARIEAMVSQLVGALAPKPPPAPAEDPVALRAEYQIAVDIIKLLSDIRFRCLAFVTALATVANALLPATGDPGTRLALGMLGLLATLGITIYELRNSQLYEVAIHRAKTLESRLEMRRSSANDGDGGLFNERPDYIHEVHHEAAEGTEPSPPRMRFWLVSVKHDHGLALIYGAALGAWVYLVAYGLLALPAPAGLWPAVSVSFVRLMSGLIGIGAGVLAIQQFRTHDKNRLKKPRPGKGSQSNSASTAG